MMKPDPVYVTTEQGGELIAFEKHVHHYTVHSIHFSDGSVFDCYNGWRDAAVSQAREMTLAERIECEILTAEIDAEVVRIIGR